MDWWGSELLCTHTQEGFVDLCLRSVSYQAKKEINVCNICFQLQACLILLSLHKRHQSHITPDGLACFTDNRKVKVILNIMSDSLYTSRYVDTAGKPLHHRIILY
jgi:hypothetical protein